jgi:DNA repair protein RecN (Recombination protein N)
VGYINDIELSLYELENVDIDEILDRLEQIDKLIQKYGSVEGILEAKQRFQQQLSRLKRLERTTSDIEKQIQDIERTLLEISNQLLEKRKGVIDRFAENLDRYLELLNMGKCEIGIYLNSWNFRLEIKIDGVPTANLSQGEKNRARLAILALRNSDDEVPLFLDEIDANLSGEEARKVVMLLKEISKNRQVIAISHQPQLAAKADQHFVVLKGGMVKELQSREERVEELVRMIGKKSKEVYEFVNSYLE